MIPQSVSYTHLSGASEKPELLEMIAGYIAYRMRKKYPERGNV